MKAIVRDRYGLDSLELRETEPPKPTEDRVLARVRASSVNPVDWYDASGLPYVMRAMSGLRRPRLDRVGSDFAAIVESTGEAGYGVANGAFGEYVAVRRDR